MKKTDYKANTQGQSLSQHLIVSANLARDICLSLTGNKNIAQCAYVAGLMHDFGKIDPSFQKWVKGKIKAKSEMAFPENGQHIESERYSFDNNARHNEMSTFFLYMMSGIGRKSVKAFLLNNGFTNADKMMLDIIAHSVFWHHSIPLRKKQFTSMFDVYQKTISKKSEDFFAAAVGLMENLPLNASIDMADLEETIGDVCSLDIPEYKHYSKKCSSIEDFRSDTRLNALCNLVRVSVITSDKIVSGLSCDLLNHLAESGDVSSITPKVSSSDLVSSILVHGQRFFPDSKRTKEQVAAARLLSFKDDVAVLSGEAGSGKTKAALEYALKKGAQKLYWIVPRVSVGQSVFKELTSDEYALSTKIELLTGEISITHHLNECYSTPDSEKLSGSIVITTIDQILNGSLYVDRVHILKDFLSSCAIFDEFHEYTTMSGMDLLFCELIESRKMSEKSDTLLISATPNPLFLEALLEVGRGDIVKLKSFNENRYEIKLKSFDDSGDTRDHPLMKKPGDRHFVIANTALKAQQSFIFNSAEDRCKLIHSRLGAKDKAGAISDIMRSFSKKGDNSLSSVLSGPIMQASFNISADQMTSEISTAENILQRLGRLGRFGEGAMVYQMTILYSESLAKRNRYGDQGVFLARSNSFNNASLFLQQLMQEDLRNVGLGDLYGLYDRFYRNPKFVSEIKKDMLRFLIESSARLSDVVGYPLWIKPKEHELGAARKMKIKSVRGSSRFVDMPILSIMPDGNMVETGKYFSESGELLTLSISDLTQGDPSIVQYMLKKHHQIDRFGADKAYSVSQLLTQARDACFPIYTAYLENDLAEINESQQDGFIYYVKINNQSVGSMSIKNLTKIRGLN